MSVELGLKEKVVVITGGSSGIGKEAAKAFAAEGCRLCVCGRSPEKLAAVTAEFKEAGWSLLPVVADVSRTEEIRQVAEAAYQEYGQIDVWVNNAGVNVRKGFDQVTEEEWYRLVDTNFKSVYFGSAVAAEYLKKNENGGVILNTSSFTSLIPTAGIALYSALKAAIDNLTKTMAAELASSQIRVNSIIPGYIETPLTRQNVADKYDELLSSIPLKRLGQAEDLAAAYVFLASAAASYINGISLPVAGGKFATQNPHWSWSQ